jgi:hypothetical protein
LDQVYVDRDNTRILLCPPNYLAVTPVSGTQATFLPQKSLTQNLSDDGGSGSDGSRRQYLHCAGSGPKKQPNARKLAKNMTSDERMIESEKRAGRREAIKTQDYSFVFSDASPFCACL